MRLERAHTTLVTALVLGGCATSGVGTGELATPGKQRAGDVELTWTAEPDATRGTIAAVLPDGRVFRGTFMQVTSTTIVQDLTPYWTTWGQPWYGWGYPVVRDDWAFVRSYSGRVIAQLEGPEGQRMRCRFTLARPEDGPQSGGMGDCELTTGERVEYAVLRGEDG